MEMIRKIFIAGILYNLFCSLPPICAQELFYPDGTRWGTVEVHSNSTSNNHIDSTYTIINGNTLYTEYVVEGTTVVSISDTESMTCQVLNAYSYNFDNELVKKSTTLFRQSGDSIFCCVPKSSGSPYYIDELNYVFSPWNVGENAVIGYGFNYPILEETLERKQLADGNYYDYLYYTFRTIGKMHNGILPSVGQPRIPQFNLVTYFIRNNVLIYQKTNLIWPEGYTSNIQHPFNDISGKGQMVYSLQGVVVGNSRNLDALPRGIYIQNGKKILVGR